MKKLLILSLLLFATFAQAQTPDDPFKMPGIFAITKLVPNPEGIMYRHTGEQYRVYSFPGTGESIPYRLFVPETWTPDQHLPILITLRAGNSIDNNHRNNNDLVVQARKHGYIVISPLGYRGLSQPYYDSPFPVKRPNGPSQPGKGWTTEENQRAELDVLYVLGLVEREYNADTSRVYLHGQNPSGSGALYLAAKYPDVFKAIVISSGPIVMGHYPFDKLKGKVAVMVIHGDKDTSNSITDSEQMAQTLKAHGIDAEFHIVPGGEHLTAYLDYAPEIFDFLDKHK